MANWQGMYANGVLVSDGTTMSGTTLIRSSTVTSNVSLSQGAVKINLNGVLVSDSVMFHEQQHHVEWINAWAGCSGQRRSTGFRRRSRQRRNRNVNQRAFG